ncbi:hypothetical protein LUZ60_010799 [Juncus effusus]|nr:hypothetical protein LUZ60_010799 [Juncus effusus]
MSYPDAAFISCIVAIVKSFNWRRVIAVYEDDEYGTMSNTALLFSRALNEVGSELEYSAVFEPLKTGSDPMPSIQNELEEMKKQLSTVYVVLRSSKAFALSLFQEATAKEMMGTGSVWICGNDITSLLGSTFDQSFISHYMQGVLGVESYINVDNTRYPTFSSTFKQAFKKEFENKGETVFAPGVFAFRAYDIVQAIAKASVMSLMNGKSLVENLMDTNFTGFSRGNISVFRLINVVGYSYKELGFWLDGFGFCGNEAELRARSYSQNLNVVFWPGGLKTNPGGLRKLRVGLPANPVWEGFVTVSVDKNRTVTDGTGFCIDVFKKVLERMESNNYKIEYEYVPFLMRSNSSFDYEYNPRNGNKSTSEFTYDDLVNQVYLKVHHLCFFQ